MAVHTPLHPEELSRVLACGMGQSRNPGGFMRPELSVPRSNRLLKEPHSPGRLLRGCGAAGSALTERPAGEARGGGRGGPCTLRSGLAPPSQPPAHLRTPSRATDPFQKRQETENKASPQQRHRHGRGGGAGAGGGPRSSRSSALGPHGATRGSLLTFRQNTQTEAGAAAPQLHAPSGVRPRPAPRGCHQCFQTDARRPRTLPASPRAVLEKPVSPPRRPPRCLAARRVPVLGDSPRRARTGCGRRAER